MAVIEKQMTCELHFILLFSKLIFKMSQKFIKNMGIFTHKCWMKIGKLLLRKLNTKISIFHQSHCSHKYNFEHCVQQGFKNNLMKCISKFHKELWIEWKSQLPIFSWPHFTSWEHHSCIPLSVTTFGGVVIVFWYIFIYICKMTQYCADTRDQILQVEEPSAESHPS